MAAVETSEQAAPAAEDGGVRRRDFINIGAAAFGGVGAVGLLFPLINQMNPSADVLALAQIDVDVSAIQSGQAIKTIWRKQPIFIRNLTPAEQAAANAVDTAIRENLCAQAQCGRTRRGIRPNGRLGGADRRDMNALPTPFTHCETFATTWRHACHAPPERASARA